MVGGVVVDIVCRASPRDDIGVDERMHAMAELSAIRGVLVAEAVELFKPARRLAVADVEVQEAPEARAHVISPVMRTLRQVALVRLRRASDQPSPVGSISHAVPSVSSSSFMSRESCRAVSSSPPSSASSRMSRSLPPSFGRRMPAQSPRTSGKETEWIDSGEMEDRTPGDERGPLVGNEPWEGLVLPGNCPGGGAARAAAELLGQELDVGVDRTASKRLVRHHGEGERDGRDVAVWS